MRPTAGRCTLAIVTLLMAAWGGILLYAQAAPPAQNPLLRLAEPWPDAGEMQRRKHEAEGLRLFATDDPIAFTLTGDFKSLNRDRNPDSRKEFPAQLTLAEVNSQPRTIPVTLRARGHSRRKARACSYVPIRMQLLEAQTRDTVFDGQDALKLVVQCRNGGAFEQYLLREYLAYRVMNVLTPRSFRARLARIDYIDQSGAPAGTRHGMLLEDDADVAKRMEGRIVEPPRAQFTDLDTGTLDTMMLFEYLIGSTDFSIYALHNVVLVQTPARILYPVPYDFDLTGLVAPPYASSDQRLPIASVKERLYRGPCRTIEQLESTLGHFRAQRDRVLALPDSIAGLSRSSRDEATKYLNAFFASIREQKDVTRLFIDGCTKAPTM